MNVQTDDASLKHDSDEVLSKKRSKDVTKFLEECAPKIESLLQRLGIPQEHREDARQEASIVILEALRDFETARGVRFWTFAYLKVMSAIQCWMGRGLYWCAVAGRNDDEDGEQKRKSACRRGTHVSLPDHIDQLVSTDETPETLLSEFELTEQIRVFLEMRSRKHRELLLLSSSKLLSPTKAAQREQLLKAAREFLGEEDEVNNGPH